MDFGDLIPAADAARRLNVSQARIRALITAGVLDGEKAGGRWFVSVGGIRRRERWGPVEGRPLQPENAWAALMLGSGITPTWIPSDDVRRLAQMLDDQGVLSLAPRMSRRALTRYFYGHPGVLRAVAAASEVRLTGISAAQTHDLGLVGGGKVDAYVSAHALEPIVTRFALEPRDAGGNVSLRTPPPELAHLIEAPIPLAAVALDLAEETDARSAETGTAALQRLDDEKRWHSVLP